MDDLLGYYIMLNIYKVGMFCFTECLCGNEALHLVSQLQAEMKKSW